MTLPEFESDWQRPILSDDDADLYIARLELTRKDLLQNSKYEIVDRLMTASLCSIPYDTTLLHFGPRDMSQEHMQFGAGPGVPYIFADPFDRAVRHRSGGLHCFGLNVLLSSLLRYLGFEVTEMACRNLNSRAKPPTWLPVTHAVLFVSIEGSLYLCDVGHSLGASTSPILLQHGAKATSLIETETFEVRQEPLPSRPFFPTQLQNSLEGWTLYRHLAPRSAGEPPKQQIVYHIHKHFLFPFDIAGLHHVVAWMPFQADRLLVTRYPPNGNRQVLIHLKGEEAATYYEREGLHGNVIKELSIAPSPSAIRLLIREEFEVGS